jgi:hypothetical protein
VSAIEARLARVLHRTLQCDYLALQVAAQLPPFDRLMLLTHAACCMHRRWEPMLGVLAVGLLPQLRNEQVGYLCHLVRVLHSTQDYLALVALLLQVRGAALQRVALVAVHSVARLVCLV